MTGQLNAAAKESKPVCSGSSSRRKHSAGHEQCLLCMVRHDGFRSVDPPRYRCCTDDAGEISTGSESLKLFCCFGNDGALEAMMLFGNDVIGKLLNLVVPDEDPVE